MCVVAARKQSPRGRLTARGYWQLGMREIERRSAIETRYSMACLFPGRHTETNLLYMWQSQSVQGKRKRLIYRPLFTVLSEIRISVRHCEQSSDRQTLVGGRSGCRDAEVRHACDRGTDGRKEQPLRGDHRHG